MSERSGAQVILIFAAKASIQETSTLTLVLNLGKTTSTCNDIQSSMGLVRAQFTAMTQNVIMT